MAIQAGISIISTTNILKVDFGDYEGISSANGVIPKKRTYQKHFIEFSLPPNNSDFIIAITHAEPQSFPISYDGAANTFKIDSIDNSSISSNDDLFDKLTALLG